MDRRSDAPVWTDKDAEGLPDTEDQPPGYDAETALEGSFPPRDQPVAADDWGTTRREERLGESLRRRVSREQPDVDVADPEADMRLEDEDPDAGAPVVEQPAQGPSAEESALHIERP